MPRLFVAVEIPPTIKERIASLKTRIPTARWVNADNMHITLRFIGEVSDKDADAYQTALQGIECESFELSISGVGRFPSGKKKAPRVLWTGINAQPELDALQVSVDRALKSAGFKPNGRAFSPHITVARLKLQKPVAEVDRFLTDNADFVAGMYAVDHFALIESTLTPQGAIYTNRAIYRLV